MECVIILLATVNISSNQKKFFQIVLTKSHLGQEKNFWTKKFFQNILTKSHFGYSKKFLDQKNFSKHTNKKSV